MDNNDLESALNKATEEKPTQPQPSSEEIGFHKGSLNTLVAERNELLKMVGNVEAIMKAHIEKLKELGVEMK